MLLVFDIVAATLQYALLRLAIFASLKAAIAFVGTLSMSLSVAALRRIAPGAGSAAHVAD
ncbi:MAG TPA: hypothetical protein VGD96_21760 [Bradyrhizobium sp.]